MNLDNLARISDKITLFVLIVQVQHMKKIFLQIYASIFDFAETLQNNIDILGYRNNLSILNLNNQSSVMLIVI